MPNRLEPQNESGVQRYLNALSIPLPPTEQELWRSEAAQHLDSLIAAYEELGHDRAEASRLALERFGQAEELGRHLAIEAARKSQSRIIFRNIISFAMPASACFCLLGISTAIYGETGSESLLRGLAAAGHIFQFAVPVLGGISMGLRAPRGTTALQLLLSAVASLPLCLADYAIYVCVTNPSWSIQPAALAYFPLWVPVAVTAALIMQNLRDRQPQARAAA